MKTLFLAAALAAAPAVAAAQPPAAGTEAQAAAPLPRRRSGALGGPRRRHDDLSVRHLPPAGRPALVQRRGPGPPSTRPASWCWRRSMPEDQLRDRAAGRALCRGYAAAAAFPAPDRRRESAIGTALAECSCRRLPRSRSTPGCLHLDHRRGGSAAGLLGANGAEKARDRRGAGAEQPISSSKASNGR